MSSSPLRSYGLISLVALVVGNTIGAGVFTTSGFALETLGSPHIVMLAWLVGGGVAICGALSYGVLARHLAESGGEYLYLGRMVHPSVGFVAGWISLVAGFTGAIAYAALTFEEYVFHDLARPSWLVEGAAATLLIVAAALAHAVRPQSGTRLQDALVILKIVALLVLVGIAVGRAPVSLDAPLPAVEAMPWAAFGATLMWVSYSFSGFNAAVYVAGEAAEARRNVPRALLVGTLVIAVLYLALNAVFVYWPPQAAVAGQADVAALAARAIGGEWLATGVRAIIALALVTSVSAMVVAGPRVYAKMADDGYLPRALRQTGASPVGAIVLQAAIAILLVWLTGLQEMLSFLGITLALTTCLAVGTTFKILRDSGQSRWFHYLPPALYILATLLFSGLAAARNPVEVVASLATLALGFAIYWLGFGRPRAR